LEKIVEILESIGILVVAVVKGLNHYAIQFQKAIGQSGELKITGTCTSLSAGTIPMT
jgi:hypothetical protein